MDIGTAANVAAVSFPACAVTLAVISAWRDKGKQQFKDQGPMPSVAAPCLDCSGVKAGLKNVLAAGERIELAVGRCTTTIDAVQLSLGQIAPRVNFLEEERERMDRIQRTVVN